jgi:ATP-binding cassette subfamily C exporter for protease/lipase/ATP-binding cassette subfamily C protein EexD
VRTVVTRLKPYLFFAGLFSLAINLLLLAPPLYMLQVFDRVLSSRSNETLLLLTAGVAIALLTMAALDVIRAWLLAAGGVVLDRMLGPGVLEGLLSRAVRGEGSAYAAGLRDVHCLRSFFGGSGILALFDAPWLPVFLLIIFLFHPLMGVLALAGALLMLGLAFLNERLTRQPLERAQAEGRRAGGFIDASLRNAEVVGALGMLAAVTRRWSQLNEAALAAQAQAGASGATVSGLTKFARQLIQIAMLAAGAYLVVEQQVTAGVMIAATILLGRALAPVELLVAGWRSLVEARAAWRRLGELLAAPAAGTGTDLPAPAGRLAAEQVVYGIRGAERPIIRGATFSLAPGEALGIIGPSASGKSTLARLAVGILKPLSGAVRLDGSDVAAWPRAGLGPSIGYLPQAVELFPGTVAANIARLGEPDPAAVIRAAQAAHVHELILRLPKGYDTELGEGSQALSPGQRQRIALARALYGAPRLVVLDEPNASLDHEGDMALLQALRRLKEEGATVLIVAHRPSLLSGVDKLLVLREGAVDAFGPRAEIMARLNRAASHVREAA